jgi:hypothetical protein
MREEKVKEMTKTGGRSKNNKKSSQILYFRRRSLNKREK